MNILATHVTIDWGALPIIIMTVIGVAIIWNCLIVYVKVKVKKHVLNFRFEEALKLALILQKISPSSVIKDENSLVIALLYLNKGDETNWIYYVSQISRPQLLAAKNYWIIIAAMIANDRKAVEQSLATFKNTVQFKSKRPWQYEYYEKNLKIVMDYFETPNEENSKKIDSLVEESNPLQAAILSKLKSNVIRA